MSAPCRATDGRRPLLLGAHGEQQGGQVESGQAADIQDRMPELLARVFSRRLPVCGEAHGLCGEDPVLRGDEYLRFLPTRFTVQGEALDPRGFPTTDMACPRCHLGIPGAMLEVPPLFVSLIGSQASGKSYFLTTMTWSLRQFLPQAMLRFEDADPVANAAIHEYERTLFLNPHPDQPTEIRKTDQLDSVLHKIVTLDGVDIRFPRPLQFTLCPMPGHQRSGSGSQAGRLLILYDNAGEDFRPSVESAQSAVVVIVCTLKSGGDANAVMAAATTITAWIEPIHVVALLLVSRCVFILSIRAEVLVH